MPTEVGMEVSWRLYSQLLVPRADRAWLKFFANEIESLWYMYICTQPGNPIIAVFIGCAGHTEEVVRFCGLHPLEIGPIGHRCGSAAVTINIRAMVPNTICHRGLPAIPIIFWSHQSLAHTFLPLLPFHYITLSQGALP
jgi:hypothetical protein